MTPSTALRSMCAAIVCAAFLLHAADFPKPYNSEPGNPTPMPAAESVKKIRASDGFRVSLFASEPDVQNPIAMAWDGRGRLWIAENYTYAERAKRFDLALHDRILIFEDADGDGRAESRKVFADNLEVLTSVLPGDGGVWAMCPPNLVFIPDANGDDTPDAPAQIVLDGFTVPKENYHNFANGLKWGPDGWLYGRCGASSPGDIGVPGTPAENRVPMRGTMWRFNTKTKVFEALSHGTTNPWGHDWNEAGELFFINTVNGHFWHAIPGAHYVRPHTRDPNPYAFDLIDLHADHWHFDTGKSWTDSRDGKASTYGGGHAHVGGTVYLGGNWPENFRGRFLTFNQHGRRLNVERIERAGSGYVAKHEPDVIFFDDPWTRIVDLDYGPDGAVYAIDWSDTGECHDSTGVHRESGRIYKIAYGVTASVSEPVNLAKLSNTELAKLHTHSNEWFTRQARIELTKRANAGKDMADAKAALLTLFNNSESLTALRSLMSLHCIGAADATFLTTWLRHKDERIRAQAVKLLTDAWPQDRIAALAPQPATAKQCAKLLPEFVNLAKEDSSALVRLALASALQRINIAQRAELATALVERAEDANDYNLPKLVWYGLIPVAESDAASLVKVADACAWPTTRRYIARRLAMDNEKNPAALNALLEVAIKKEAAVRNDVLAGLIEAFTGWRKAAKPASWDAFVAQSERGANDATKAKLANLGALFGDGRVLDEVRRIATDGKADIEARKVALQTLIDNRAEGLRGICEGALYTKYLNNVAVRGLALENDPALGAKMAGAIKSFDRYERPTLISILTTRPAWALALLDAVEKGNVDRAEITASFLRQLRALEDEPVNKRITVVLGETSAAPAGKQKLIAALRAKLSPETIAKADAAQGRALFTALCSACHTLYGLGGKIGPDLTGSQRNNLDYLLENIADPAAVVSPDFRVSNVTLKDGRRLVGMIGEKTDKTIAIKTASETLTLERNDIATITDSTASMMPDGLIDALPDEHLRNLFAYLMTSAQVPLPTAK